MRIVSIAETLKRGEFFDLFNPALTNSVYTGNYFVYEVTADKAMRLDLIMLEMYEESYSVLENMDIICYINKIDNPLNIYAGMKLIYPPEEAFDKFRLDQLRLKAKNKNTVQQALGVPDKRTKRDPNRKKYIDNGFSLPPTVRAVPQEPVQIDSNKIRIGGL